MNFSTTAIPQPADIAAPARPSAFGNWIRFVLKRAFAASPKAIAPRDRAREAAQVRAFAMTMRDSDPGFAADLFAAADRHELMQD